MNSHLRIRGARTHNLKNIDLDLPKNSLIVITGLSGSGKSSLAFDTLYAEGQRRYVESLSAYARQFLQLMEKPDVDLIEGLSPAIAIEQKATSHNPRSTVGTVTELHDYLRLLFARVGTPFCPTHGHPLHAQTVSQMVDTLDEWPEDTPVMILAPLIEGRKGEYLPLFASLQAEGFVRVRVDGQLYLIEEVPALARNQVHTIEVVIDRMKLKATHRARLAESLETALERAEGRVSVESLDGTHRQLFSARFACPECGYSLRELAPRLFSFNSPHGACPTCEGLGHHRFFDPKKVLVNEALSLPAGAIAGWDRRNAKTCAFLEHLAQSLEFDLNAPFSSFGSTLQHQILTLATDQLSQRYRETETQAVRDELSRLQSMAACPECEGSRLKIEARHVEIGGQTLPTLCEQPLDQTLHFFEQLNLSGQRAEIASKILLEIKERLGFLINVGLSYLTLARSAETLSGGEAQRIRLASQIGSGLTGVMYVLDEPSIGLHQRDNDRLLATLRHLQTLGNTVIVVEHDEDAIRHADWVVDIGPGAGEHGGRVVASAPPEEIAQSDCLTGLYLSGRKSIPIPTTRRTPTDRWLYLIGASGHNLQTVDLALPVGCLTCITGVSGSGKSTLIHDTLYPLVTNHLNRSNLEVAAYQEIKGLEHFDKIVNVDQSPIGRTPRSNPATYTGLFTPIRELFASVPLARERGYNPGRFSFNVKGGRCEACQGDGVIRVEMHFLPDVHVECEVCKGQRYNRETLEIVYKNKTIHDVLMMTVEQAAAFFEAIPAVARRLQTLMDVGLGYIRLGQAATTLSGGEAQRVKLALELSKRDTGNTLYLLDEPTTGLHFEDVALLLGVFQRLLEQGNTMVIIEHHLDVIKTADWIVDLGPEGGTGGGRILAEGSPETVAEMTVGHTARFLKAILDKKI